MARVTVLLPRLLGPIAQGRRELPLEADTLSEAFDRLREVHPAIALHFFDESGGLRRHVLCFWNETNTRWLSGDENPGPLRDGDTLLFMQAVSGG